VRRAVPPPTLRDVPAVAAVVCNRDGAVARTRLVRPQRDGVHIRIDNRSGARAFWIWAVDGDENQGGRLPADGRVVKTAFSPGEVLVGCFKRLRDVSYTQRVGDHARVSVVDPEGLWTPSRFVCGRPVIFGRFRAAAASEQMDPERLIARVLEGLLPTDVLVRPGYPGTQYHSEPRLIVRDGDPIAEADVFQEHGWWKVEVRACPGSGFSGNDTVSS
jgi:hypothetical protein